MHDFNDPIYAEFEKETMRDDRVGKHLFCVTEVVNDSWSDGSPRLKIKGILKTTSNGAKTDMTFSALPSPEEVKELGATWSREKKFGISTAIRLMRDLDKHYGLKYDQLKEGDEFNVLTVKNKDGFIRISQILDKAAVKSGGKSDVDIRW